MENPFTQITERLEKIEKLLKNSSIKPIEKSELRKADQFLNIDGACKLLMLKKSTIYSKVNRNELPYYKRDKHLYFSYTELINYVKVGKVKSDKDLKEEANQYINYNLKNKHE